MSANYRMYHIEAKIKALFDQLYSIGRDEGAAQVLGEVPKVLPHPCDGPLYDDWTLMDYLHKMDEENHEAFMACRDYDREPTRDNRHKAIWEVTDLIIGATSVLAKLGAKEPERQDYVRCVNDSNAVRDDGRRFRED